MTKITDTDTTQDQAYDKSALQHYCLIDQIRGILAWIVVLSHIIWYTGIITLFPKLGFINLLGHYSVLIFIIISGFVITHLTISRRESYLLYIWRRALRLFPVYYVCLALGILATYISFGAQEALLAGHPEARANLEAQQVSLSQFTLLHILAHLTMLHGAVPDNILFYSQMMFLSPAWSLSLEWQLYLVAPAVIWLLRSAETSTSVAAITVVALLTWLYSKGVFGFFELPSFLPGGLIYFVIGALSRIYLDKIPALCAYPYKAAAALLALGFSISGFLPIAIWVCVFTALKLKSQHAEMMPVRYIQDLLQYLGLRSYSTYLVHVPIIQLAITVSVELLGFGVIGSATIVMLTAVPMIFVASSLLYRFVERPMIAVGRGALRRPVRLDDRDWPAPGSADTKLR